MKTILNNWSIMRILRFLLAIAAVTQAVVQKDIIIGLLGVFLLVTALLNIGYCGSSGCSADLTNRKKVNYDKMDNKK